MGGVFLSLPMYRLCAHEVEYDARIDRLDKVLVETGRAAALAVSVLPVACQGNKAACAELCLFTQVREQLIAIHDWQPDIQDCHVRYKPPEDCKSSTAALGWA